MPIARKTAKLTWPSHAAALRRERLFALLDDTRKLTWIAGSAGAGKTVLIATWLEARGLRALWYSIDPRDADPMSLLSRFRLAAGKRLKVSGLPEHAPEEHVGQFARRFFAQVFAVLQAPLVIVLDDYHEVARDSALHEVTEAMVSVAPPLVRIVIASRTVPPPRFARWRANASFRDIGGSQLDLTRREMNAICAAHGVASKCGLRQIQELSCGWAAGTVLLARALAQGVKLPARSEAPPRAVLDYFAVEVFPRISSDLRAFLLRTAWLPTMTLTAAAAVSNASAAATLLDELLHEHLFISCSTADEPVFEYHPLFRGFLLAHARKTIDSATLQALRRKSAAVLIQRGETDSAVKLHAANGDWSALAAVVREHAPVLAAHGRYPALGRWLDVIPNAAYACEPWLAYWLGCYRIVNHDAGHRGLLEQAFGEFKRVGDVEGQFASCAWLLRSSMSVEQARAWIAVAEHLATTHPRFHDPELEERVISRFQHAHQFPARHPLVQRWTSRAEYLARTLDNVGGRIRMAAFALAVHVAHGDIRRAGVTIAETEPLAHHRAAPRSDAILYLFWLGYYRLQIGDRSAAERVLVRMERLAAAENAIQDQAIVWHLGFRARLYAGDLERARFYHARLEPLADYFPLHGVHTATATVYLRLLERDVDAALGMAHAICRSGIVCPMFQPMCLASLGQVLLEQGATESALAELDAALSGAKRACLRASECAALLLRAAACFRLGLEDAAYANLSAGLAIARDLGCVPQQPFILPTTLSQLTARALERGIEREFVVKLVARYRLPPPGPEEERWPWSVRVRVLGPFEITVDDEPLDSALKTQRKPLELLKYTIAMGGRDVGAAAVMQALWPDAEGDAAKRSFDITLHRLRRTLRRDDAIILEGGKLALNPGIVWADALAFARLAGQAAEALRTGSASAAELLERALRLVRGALLASDDEPWTQPARARLRGRYLQLVGRAGDFWERSGAFDAALACYQRALEHDASAEAIYQRLMRLLHACGRRSEGIETYQRCREVLAAMFGARPSTETEALRQRLFQSD